MVDYMVSLLGDNVHRARRNNKIFYKGRYVKYPFENGLFDLEPQDRFECLYHYIKNDYPPPQTNFKEWIYHHFGKGLAEKYLIPYNEKIWNVPAEELGLEWVEGRVPKPPVEDVIKAAVGVETEGYTHQLYFHYPAHGGIESLPARDARARTAISSRISPSSASGQRSGSRWCVSNGRRTRRYDALVSHHSHSGTGRRAGRHAARDSRRSQCAALQLAGHRLGRPRLPRVCPITPPSTFPIPRSASIACRSRPLSARTTRRPANPSSRPKSPPIPATARTKCRTKRLLADVIGDLQDMDLVRRSEICYSRVLRTKYGYVVQNDDCRRYLKHAKAYFEQIGIPLCGRVAEFEYINMDVCIERARKVAERLNREALPTPRLAWRLPYEFASLL